jgi:hypothetical protein
MAFYSKYTTNNTLIFDQLIRAYVLVEETLSPVLPVCLVKQLKCFCKIFVKFAAKFHTYTLFFRILHCHFVTNPTNSLARAQFSGCSSTTNAHSETGQMAGCCQNLILGAFSSRYCSLCWLVRYIISSVSF